MWRIATNSLPVRINLKRRGMDIDTLCPVCHRRDEDGSHLLFQCKLVRQLWRQMGLEHIQTECKVLHDPKEVVTALLKGNVDQTASIMALLWHWWNARNKKRVGMKEIDITALLWQTRKTAEEYKDFFEKAKYEKVNQMGGWTKPVEGRLKINVDGSFNKDTLSGGWGYVIRDHEGDVVIVAAGRLNHAMDALHAEAEACTQALYKAQELGIVHAAIETNALLLVSAIKSSSYDLAPYGVLFKEIRAFPSLNFSSFDIVHCPRASNKEQKIKEDYRDEKGHLLFDLNEAWAGN
ncbi:hypothetical protein D1007_35331 [Hordeum vulgare]|nr:hypothetical protein D1007_35331 [Hordeum vulgare]